MSAKPDDDPLAVRLLYSPHSPEPPQHAFLLLDQLGVTEACYGGAAGGGKSDALLMAAMQYVDVPGYAALLLRKTFADLALPGALMDRAHTWLQPTNARWSSQLFRWTFPSSASLTFGYLQTSMDRYRYASAEFQFIGFDELTQFPEDDYRFLFTRLRRPSDIDPDNMLARVPLRMRSATNPGGRGHKWVKRRLIRSEVDPDDPEDTAEKAAARVFIPAKLDDNPHIDRDGYKASLGHVDPFLRQQMLDGDWDAQEPGDWVYDRVGLDAALALGDEYDLLLAAGLMPPPSKGLLAIGLDWGEYTGAVILWPLEAGGLYVVAAGEYEGLEPGEAMATVIGDLLDEQDPNSKIEGLLEGVVNLGRTRPAPHRAPALREAGDPLTLVESHRYDAAGLSSMRTYVKRVRKRHPKARSTKVSFGAPAPKSGGPEKRKSYKAETIGYTRRLLKRSADGKTTGMLAISRERALVFADECRSLEWLDRHAGTVRKGDDHAHDAGIAAIAPIAIRNR